MKYAWQKGRKKKQGMDRKVEKTSEKTERPKGPDWWIRKDGRKV